MQRCCNNRLVSLKFEPDLSIGLFVSMLEDEELPRASPILGGLQNRNSRNNDHRTTIMMILSQIQLSFFHESCLNNLAVKCRVFETRFYSFSILKQLCTVLLQSSDILVTQILGYCGKK